MPSLVPVEWYESPDYVANMQRLLKMRAGKYLFETRLVALVYMPQPIRRDHRLHELVIQAALPLTTATTTSNLEGHQIGP